jgi:hypothetical protein
VEAFADLRNLLASGFDFMTTLGHHFPQAVAATPLREKVRLEVWEDGKNYCKSMFLLGFSSCSSAILTMKFLI